VATAESSRKDDDNGNSDNNSKSTRQRLQSRRRRPAGGCCRCGVLSRFFVVDSTTAAATTTTTSAAAPTAAAAAVVLATIISAIATLSFVVVVLHYCLYRRLLLLDLGGVAGPPSDTTARTTTAAESTAKSPLLSDAPHPSSAFDYLRRRRQPSVDGGRFGGGPPPVENSDGGVSAWTNATGRTNADSPRTPAAAAVVRPLRWPTDYEQFTVRINSWKRPEQLRTVLDHYRTACSNSNRAAAGDAEGEEVADSNSRPLVAQIQVVWCTDQGPPPPWLADLATSVVSDGGTRNTNSSSATSAIIDRGRPSYNSNNRSSAASPPIVLELHEKNSLNERFRLLLPDDDEYAPNSEHQPKLPNSASKTVTAAILSVDDDLLRPCEALEAGFAKWVRNPDRMVGYDARSHEVAVDTADAATMNDTTDRGRRQDAWKYGYLSTTQSSNRYSLSLTRFCFVHRDHLRSYFAEMPSKIRRRVDDKLNCEDVALSLWVSKLSGGKVPLLADCWAMRSMVKLYSQSSISGTKGHKKTRDQCVNDFAEWLGLKNGGAGGVGNEASGLETHPFVRNDRDPWLDCGDDEGSLTDRSRRSPGLVDRTRLASSSVQRRALELRDRWKIKNNPESKSHEYRQQHEQRRSRELGLLQSRAAVGAYERGLLKDTEPWRRRFQK